jgi:protein involved in polysaccharide export with SLBB domain
MSACGAVNVSDPAPLDNIKAGSAGSVPTAYKIGAGDEIELKFFFAPDLNDRMTVRPDGKISVLFAQDVQAAGSTPEELSDRIRKLLSSHVKQPEVTVVVRTMASQKVFVGGEVAKPGPVQLTQSENILQVLDEAGWVTPFAGRSEVTLIRHDASGKESAYVIDIDDLTSGDDMSQNVTVMAGDVIVVPPSNAVAADRWVDQYIRQVLPFSTNAGAYYQLNNIGLLK